MSAASTGAATARVALPEEPDLEDMPTRLAVALNMLLDDLAYQVAERERMEERLRQSQKLEAIGSLAGGIAHDFNNLLSVILGYTDLLLGDLPEGPLRSDLEEVRRAGERARDLTRQLLAFSRRQILEPRVLDINTIVHGMEKMLRRMLGEDVILSLLTFTRLAKVAGPIGLVMGGLGAIDILLRGEFLRARLDLLEQAFGILEAETLRLLALLFDFLAS